MFRVDVPKEIADTYTDLSVEVVGSSTTGAMPCLLHLVAQSNTFPNEWGDYEYSSGSPLNYNPFIVVPHASLTNEIWYFLLVNKQYDTVDVEVETAYEGWCPCAFEHGTCSSQLPTICNCSAGWQGGACDVSTSTSTSGTDGGTVAALVIVMIFLGVVIGVVVTHKWPHIFAGTAKAASFESGQAMTGASVNSGGGGKGGGYNSLGD